jgi:glycosyltransferase involved in cell wall biosynthesis
MLRSNRRVLTPAIAAADLIWLKVPASNAPLAAAIAIRSGTPRFVWVAGSAADVAAGRYAGIGGLGARTVGLAYDLAGRLAAVGGRRIVVGKGVADRDGIVSSLIEADEVRDPGDRTWPPIAMPMRFAWAGRLVEGKGLEALLAAVLREPGVVLDILGDGPARGRLTEHVRAEGDWDRVTWAGHIADRSVYLDRLAGADAFVFPSPAEGFPKVVLDALAVGLPVIATRAGGLADLADSGLIEPIGGPGPEAILTAWRRLLETESQALAERRRRGVAYAADHTRPAEAARLVARWQGWWPALPWLG